MTTVQMMLSRLARPVCQSPEAAQVTEDVRGCCPSPGHSLTDSVTHECRDHCTMYTQPDITRTDSWPWGRASTADLRHLTANDNIDSTQRTQSTWHQSLPCCIDFKSVSSQCQSEYCLSVSIVWTKYHAVIVSTELGSTLHYVYPGRHHQHQEAVCHMPGCQANPPLNQQHQSK